MSQKNHKLSTSSMSKKSVPIIYPIKSRSLAKTSSSISQERILMKSILRITIRLRLSSAKTEKHATERLSRESGLQSTIRP